MFILNLLLIDAVRIYWKVMIDHLLVIGRARIWDILALFLDSRRKWRGVVHLYLQSMVQPDII